MKNKVELRHLRYFVAVADTCHFGRAAQRLHMAQPALSHAIRQLEDELGVCLLARTTRRVELTAAGKFFLKEALGTLSRIDSGINGVRLLGAGRSGVIRLGLAGAVAYSHMPKLVQSVKTELPGLEFEFHADLSTQRQCELLRDEVLDLGMVHLPVSQRDIGVTRIGSEQLILVTPAGHPLAGRAVVSAHDLREETFVTCSGQEPVISDSIERTCSNAGFTPRTGHEAASIPMLLALVSAGLGVGIVPESVRSVPVAGVGFCRLADAATVQVALAWSSSRRSALVSNVLGLVSEERQEHDRAV